MFKIIISYDSSIQQVQKVIFESSFMALHGVSYVTFSLYLIKIDTTEQIISFIKFLLPILAFLCNYLKILYCPF